MNVQYCDICANIIKNKTVALEAIEYNELDVSKADGMTLDEIAKKPPYTKLFSYEICENCFRVIMAVCDRRLANTAIVTKELNQLLALPTINNPKERKPKKKGKK